MKTIILKLLAWVVMALFSSFSFANWGGAYQYMKGESSFLPISNALYKKADGTVCVANFTGQTNFEAQTNLLEQIKDFDDTIVECSSEDIQKINTTIDQYFHNDSNSFKATKVALPAIAAPGLVVGGVVVSSLLGCVLGNEAHIRDDNLPDYPFSFSYLPIAVGVGSMGGTLVGLIAVSIFEGFVSFKNFPVAAGPFLGMASGLASALVCYKLAEDTKE